MTLSLSPLAQNFPASDQGMPYYVAPKTNSLFPGNTLQKDPNQQGNNSYIPVYPEAYLPILVQAFVLPLDKVVNANYIPDSDLNSGNRIFTYTTAKLR
jgi:hypothetical protein